MSSVMEAERLRFRSLCLKAAGELYGLCPDFTVDRPRDPKNGDLASSAALALGGALRRRPSEIAAEMAALIPLRPGERLEAGNKGFLNLYLPVELLAELNGPLRDLPEIELPDPSAPEFCGLHLYHRLKRLLEIHDPAEEEGELTAPEELRLLRAMAWEDGDELAAALADLYDRRGLGGGARRRLFNNGLYLLYGQLRKEK